MSMELETGKLLNTLEFPIRWVDMDAYRHVGQTRYLDAMTETRAQWLHNSLDKDTLNLCFYFVAETQCHFYKAFKYPGVMQIKQYCVEVQRTQFTLHYHFYSPGEEKRFALGVARMVCVDPKTERPVRLPEQLHKKLT
jgi:acyl-CoA thioester hydrolase